jgi:hypothetical protein
MEKCKLTFTVRNTAPDLRIAVELDGTIFYDAEPQSQARAIECAFDDSDALHVLTIKMSGKRTDHTRVNDAGEITEDRWVEIRDVCLDGIPIAQPFLKHAQYWHSFNTANPHQADIFWGDMGCNGTVRFEFQGPTYMWLLENM